MKKEVEKKLILAIETSCDETAVALVEAWGGLENPQFKIVGDALISQIDIHKEFGGVVPNLAKREHQKALPILLEKVLKNASKKKIFVDDIDFIAVTAGPGLEPALWAGITFSQELAKEIKKPLCGVNHLEGHLYSFLIGQKDKYRNLKFKIQDLFPAIGLIISGGHTILVKMESLGKYKKIGETVDDAVGECFDKVARMLDLPYPGGPQIEKLAKIGNKKSVNFPRPMVGQKNYNFSFSGLKTSVLYYLRDLKAVKKDFKKEDIAASFQQAAFDVLIKKAMKAADEFGAKSIMVSGGVSANKTLQKEFKEKIKKYYKDTKMEFVITDFSTDNALMIAASGYMDYLKGKKYPIKANGNLSV